MYCRQLSLLKVFCLPTLGWSRSCRQREMLNSVQHRGIVARCQGLYRDRYSTQGFEVRCAWDPGCCAEEISVLRDVKSSRFYGFNTRLTEASIPRPSLARLTRPILRQTAVWLGVCPLYQEPRRGFPETGRKG